MMYLKCDSMDANFNFALEKYAMDELDAAKEYFMFWRTTPHADDRAISEHAP